MIKNKTKQGNNLIEYVITFVLVGFVFGYALFTINPDLFKNVFNKTFVDATESNGTINIGPMTE